MTVAVVEQLNAAISVMLNEKSWPPVDNQKILEYQVRFNFDT